MLAFLSPVVARYLLPILLLVGYGLYHWWRWCMMHPKINVEDLPEPAGEVVPVKKAEDPTTEAPKPPAEAPVAEAEKPVAESAPRATRWESRREEEEAAERFALEACDPECLARTYRRARARRPEFFVRLGEYAWHRGAMIEAHFWVSMAAAHGVEGLDEWLQQIRRRWLQSGRSAEADNIYDQFPPERNMLARAMMMCANGLSVHPNQELIFRMAQDGDRDAQFILESERKRT